ncbi:MAG: NAD(P)/FAD-dependent oxidoreductase [Proteobacteria bacterium]|nr:NAD(P)/FAD-dependent oxidoreductase [Burkholderiales bacterium]
MTASGPDLRARACVIGAGPMGLAAAHALCKSGVSVTVVERDDRIGGMSAHFDLDGTRLERYYHFICKPDRTTFEHLDEFGLGARLHWTDTRMGFYYDGRLHDWGTPLSLLRFPGLSLWQKLRYGAHVMRAKSVQDWGPYDALNCTGWVQRWIGKGAYEVMWRSVFHYKFYEYQDSLSAAWLGTRIRRVALSRKNMFQEQLGYLEGGSETLLKAMAARIERLGGTIRVGAPVDEVTVSVGGATASVSAVRIAGVLHAFDTVISTVPLPLVPRLVPQLPSSEAAKIDAIRNVGVVCVIVKLKRAFSPNFWININDSRIEIPGLIEYTNLNPLDGCSILYAPYYMPQDNPKYGRPIQAFVEETLSYLALMKPEFDASDVIAATGSRYQYAQPVCTPGFHDALPPMQSALDGFFMADTAHCYPEDRSISESLRIGVQLAELAYSRMRRDEPGLQFHGV